MPNYFQRDRVFTDLVLYLVNKSIFQTSTSQFVLIFSFRAAILLCPNTICVWQVSKITKCNVIGFAVFRVRTTVTKHTFVLMLIYDKFQVLILLLRENYLSYINNEVLLCILNMYFIFYFNRITKICK